MENIEYPNVTIMIATFNSDRILERPLEAIRLQTYPQEKMEILIIDGGSKDNTIDIARRYGCKVLNNPHKDPVNAKLIGMKYASGDYLITIDHDEVLTNRDSIRCRIDAMIRYKNCKVAFCSGYKCPEGFSHLNEYISEFGDPFSLFYYRFSKGYNYFPKALSKKATYLYSDSEFEIYRFDKSLDRIIIEIVCVGTLIDLNYFRSIYDSDKHAEDFVHLFYIMIDDGYKDVIVSKNDPLEHYSVDSLKSYLPKLRWRIINNVHYAERAAQGFSGRQKQTRSSCIRKYLFPLYAISTLFPLIDAMYYAFSRRNSAFLLHPYLCWYVTIYIMFQYVRKIMGLRPALKNYDGSKLTE